MRLVSSSIFFAKRNCQTVHWSHVRINDVVHCVSKTQHRRDSVEPGNTVALWAQKHVQTINIPSPCVLVWHLQGSTLIAVGLGVAAAGLAGKQNSCEVKHSEIPLASWNSVGVSCVICQTPLQWHRVQLSLSSLDSHWLSDSPVMSAWTTSASDFTQEFKRSKQCSGNDRGWLTFFCCCFIYRSVYSFVLFSIHLFILYLVSLLWSRRTDEGMYSPDVYTETESSHLSGQFQCWKGLPLFSVSIKTGVCLGCS